MTKELVIPINDKYISWKISKSDFEAFPYYSKITITQVFKR